MVIMTVVSTLAVGTAWGAEPKDITVTKSAEKTPAASVGNVKTGKILFLGNSITLHGPLAEIGWTNNWGMAASAQEKDYVHILVRSVSEITGTTPVIMIENIADFERGYATYDLARLKKVFEFKADTVIVAIGENVPAAGSEESKTKFRESVSKLLKALKEAGNPTILVRSSFWPDKTKDEILREVCADVGGVFVDISGLSKDESNYARSEGRYAHAGVAAHPGDKGMQAIASALLAAIKGH
jgi:lysophospholipase L1-like esterase